MQKRSLFLVSCISIILFLFVVSFAQADVNYYGSSIGNLYSAGDQLTGQLNISINDENANEIVTSNMGGNFTLLQFLENSNLIQGEDFNCTGVDCRDIYQKSDELNSVSVVNSTLIGFVIGGKNSKVSKIDSLSINLGNNLGPSCSGQLKISILGEDNLTFANSNYINKSCFGNSYGCFDQSYDNYQNAIIPKTQLCEKLNLMPGPAYEIGADIENSTKSSGKLTMSLYDLNGDFIGKCGLPEIEKNSQTVGCIINYSSPSGGKFLACISSDDYNPSSETPNYEIKTEQEDPVCGTDNLGTDYSRDYAIYGKPMEFGSANVTVNGQNFESFGTGYDLKDTIYDYLSSQYNSVDGAVDCDPYCIIPFKVSGGPQTASIKNSEIYYEEGNTPFVDNKVYSISKSPSEINSGNLEIDLSSENFTIASNNSHSFELFVGGEKVLEIPLNISTSFDFSINKGFALIGQKTTFEIQSNYNITSSIWKFGDGSNPISSNSNEENHIYSKPGKFDIYVTAKNLFNQTSTKKFTITVGDAKSSANITLKEDKNRLNNLSKEINSYPDWLSSVIKNKFDVDKLNLTLSQIQGEFNSASSDDDYLKVVNSLLNLDVPYEIYVSQEGTIPADVGFDNIDASYLEDISTSGNVSDEDSLKSAIVAWIQDNYDIEVDYKRISSIGDGGVNDIATEYTINSNPTGKNADPMYLIINYAKDGITFSKDYGEKGINQGSATYIPLNEPSNIEPVSFALPSFVDVSDLGVYLSPDISKLTIPNSNPVEPITVTKKFNMGWFVFGIIVLIVIFLIIYVTLQEWYKRHYEGYLFKGKDQLYNIINFIYNGRVTGLKDGLIKDKLSKAGWSGEQLSYAFKKIDGKRTGMWEIPILKFFENKKVANEIQKRQGRPADARFIKQRRL